MTRAALAAAAAGALLAGCGPGAPEQEGAERAVERVARADARCTSRSRIWFADGPPAKLLLCTVHSGSGSCDRYRVERDGDRYRVRLIEREAACSLPPG